MGVVEFAEQNQMNRRGARAIARMLALVALAFAIPSATAFGVGSGASGPSPPVDWQSAADLTPITLRTGSDPLSAPESSYEIIGSLREERAASPFEGFLADGAGDPRDRAGSSPANTPSLFAPRSAGELFDRRQARFPAIAEVLSQGPGEPRSLKRLISHQSEALPAPPRSEEGAQRDPCFILESKRPTELTIDIAMPEGELPRNYAAACWQKIDEEEGSARLWTTFNYQWAATAFCHRPLYFEEINLERYGYGCNECLQPGVSAAHFFGTVAALPYCMVTTCPNECVYTLGHYRPGSCPPWQRNYPPCIGTR